MVCVCLFVHAHTRFFKYGKDIAVRSEILSEKMRKEGREEREEGGKKNNHEGS